MCSYWGDANLGIRSTPLATSSDSQMVKIFAFYSRAATVASTLQPNIVTLSSLMQKPTKLSQTPQQVIKSDTCQQKSSNIFFFSHWGVFMFLWIPHFGGSPPTAVGVPAMKAQRVPWVFSPPLTGHQINYPIYQREGKGPLPLSEIVFPNLFSNQTLADINLLISQMS